MLSYFILITKLEINYMWNKLFFESKHYSPFFSDCTAPYSIDIEFDAISDETGTNDNEFTSCGKFCKNSLKKIFDFFITP